MITRNLNCCSKQYPAVRFQFRILPTASISYHSNSIKVLRLLFRERVTKRLFDPFQLCVFFLVFKQSHQGHEVIFGSADAGKRTFFTEQHFAQLPVSFCVRIAFGNSSVVVVRLIIKLCISFAPVFRTIKLFILSVLNCGYLVTKPGAPYG